MGKSSKSRLFTSLLFLGVLFPSLCFVYFLGFGLSPFLLSFPVMILSTVFLLKCTKKKVILDENPAGNLLYSQNILLEKELKEGLNQVVETEKQKINELQPILETISENETAQQSESGKIHEYQEEMVDTPSESEESTVDSEKSQSFELKWISSTNMGQDFSISESSFSEDEEEDYDNLIEISLPGSDSSGQEEELKQKMQPNLPDFLPESVFSQQGFMELLADINEMNEEENLIEIDISMGSIKCPRFEIKA